MREDFDSTEGFEEFCWFAREYPRCYRFHFTGAEFRLKSVHSLMESICRELVSGAASSTDTTYSYGISDIRVEQVYWDFESFLSEVNIALDLLARVVGLAFPQQTPANFNRFCKLPGEHPLLIIFRKARSAWVSRLKDYRDCFTHYTPVDTMLMVRIHHYHATGWQLRAPLPVNPNVRDILAFRFSRRTELLRYCISTYRRLVALDRSVARAVSAEYLAGRFPVRRDHLFFVGARQRE
jgi:hypothetical protein